MVEEEVVRVGTLLVVGVDLIELEESDVMLYLRMIPMSYARLMDIELDLACVPLRFERYKAHDGTTSPLPWFNRGCMI